LIVADDPLRNLFAQIPADLSEEVTQTLLDSPCMRIERIASHGQSSPEGFWYDQPQHEWVVLLSGAARLRFENQEAVAELKAGDFLLIEAHRRHRVEWTTTEEPSVWLAIHFD